jgi:hypothetical protein
MRKLSYLLLTALLTIIMFRLSGQQLINSSALQPLKEINPVLFADDIVINDQPSQDQGNISICSAFNGWLYAIHSHIGINGGFLTTLRSTDNGNTWEVLLDGIAFTHSLLKRMTIMACGNTISDLKVFLGFVYSDTLAHTSGARVLRYSGEPFAFEDAILEEPSSYVTDLAISNDNLFPSSQSNPYSIAVLYSKRAPSDSLIFISSSNGGLSFDNRKVIAYSQKHFGNVALGYGFSPTMNTGRYFGAWQVTDNIYTDLGNIYCAHTEPNFNSPFTQPKNLDSLDVTAIKKCKNPVLVCQSDDMDNDSADLTEIILFDKYISSSNTYTTTSYFNKRAASDTHFNPFSFSSSANRIKMADLTYNPFDSTFLLTYFDSTNLKLPLLSKNVNLVNPDNWDVLSTGYNDSQNLKVPDPQVELNIGMQQGCNTWVSESSDGNGIALFDAPYHYFTGFSFMEQRHDLLTVCPNPCSDYAKVSFHLSDRQMASLFIINLLGKTNKLFSDRICETGENSILINVSGFPEGHYILTLISETSIGSTKMIITP